MAFLWISIEVYFIIILLGIPTFFFWRWLLKKLIKNDKTRKAILWSATIVTALLLYIGLIMLWFLSISYHPSYDFDTERWFSDQEKRYEMSHNIIDSKMLIGKTKSEVWEILGKGENTENSDIRSYYLWFEPGFMNIDPDVLDIEFENGKVIEVRQYES